jgi:hypothetical protein
MSASEPSELEAYLVRLELNLKHLSNRMPSSSSSHPQAAARKGYGSGF